MKGRGTGLRRALALASIVFCGSLIATQPAAATIEYRVSLAQPDRHLFGVSMTIPVEGREVTVAMPAWNALYRIQDFAYRVRDVTALCRSLDAVPASVVSSATTMIASTAARLIPLDNVRPPVLNDR